MDAALATASMYSPVTGNLLTPGAGGVLGSPGREGRYLRCFTLLKAQRTVLTSTETEIREYKGEAGPVDNDVREELLGIVQSVLSAYLVDVCTRTAETVIASIRQLLGRSNLQPQARKWAIRTLVSLISIRKTAESLVISAIFQTDANDEESESSLLAESNCVDRVKTCVCRICDEHIPSQLFEEHVESCIEAYRSESKLSKIDARLREIVDQLRREELCVDWPGIRLVALNVTVPLLQIWLMFWKCLEMDPRRADGCEALKKISGFIQNMIVGGTFARADLVKEGAALILEKSRRSIVLTHAVNVLRQTRLSGGSVGKRGATRISDFVFVKNISSGAFARVFLARKKTTGDLYAIKVLPKADVTQKNQVQRVFTERDILLTLNNPYIVNFYYSIIGKNNLYLVMEYCPGGDLFCVLHGVGRFDEETAKQYVYQVVQALKFLRSHGIIHHDLKPDNILVTASGTLKLTDFGLSHLGLVGREASSEDVTSEMVVGTPDYTAPEVIMNKEHTYTADYWSLGAMIYEFLTGIPPFHGETKQETYGNILAGNLDYSELEDNSEEAIDLIKRLLVHTPEERIGAKNIDEILQHPWLKDVDPSEYVPFIPEIRNEEDTCYFDPRGDMDFSEADILEDIEHEGEKEGAGDMHNFASVSVEQLVKKNEQVVQRLRRGSLGDQHLKKAASCTMNLDSLLGRSSSGPLQGSPQTSSTASAPDMPQIGGNH